MPVAVGFGGSAGGHWLLLDDSHGSTVIEHVFGFWFLA